MSEESERMVRLEWVGRVTAYGPLIVTALILLVQTFSPSLVDALPMQATLGILAGSVVFLVWHVETTLTQAQKSLATLEASVQELGQTQQRFIQSTSALGQYRLGSAFGTIAAARQRVGHLRVFAISSQQILSFFKFHDFTVDRCDLLIRGFDPDDAEHHDFFSQIKLVVADWRRLQVSGRIGRLVIRQYDFHPTEYECIFDDEFLVLGLYDSDPGDYSGVGVRDPILVRGAAESGRGVILEFTQRFDRLFEVCATHHGRNTLPEAEGGA